MSHHGLVFGGFLARLAFSAMLGLIIGYERQWRGRPAGAHTTGLVAAGAAIFAAIGPVLEGATAERIIANIVTGVGFLAGGVILRDGVNVTGLNTAATIWSTAAVGALTGVGLYREAFAGTIAILAVNLLAEPIAAMISAHIKRGQKQ
ncbi:MAG: MgtC/SapB family protein [Candidatus Eremiobacteraeota bacterium]|nr:MgtC/SapB family protein [Candidatus Eremiobacteraeota bacterium]